MSEKENVPTIIVVRETVTESIITDTYTFGCLIGTCLVGYFLDIPALSWIGGLMTVGAIIFRGMKGVDDASYTIAEARAKLDEIEASYR